MIAGYGNKYSRATVLQERTELRTKILSEVPSNPVPSMILPVPKLRVYALHIDPKLAITKVHANPSQIVDFQPLDNFVPPISDKKLSVHHEACRVFSGPSRLSPTHRE
jgi:hypothetical protein